MDEALQYQFNNDRNIPLLRVLCCQEGTFIEKITDTMHIGLLPSALGKLKTGIQDNLNSKLRKYDSQLDGILVGYDNLALLGGSGHMIPGYHHIHINVRADFYVFKPKVGGTLTGAVLKKSGNSVTCLTNKVFTVFVSVPPHLKHSIQLHEEISFKIERVDLLSQIPFVKGVADNSTLPAGSQIGLDSADPEADAELDSGLSSVDEPSLNRGSTATVQSEQADRTDAPRVPSRKNCRAPKPDEPLDVVPAADGEQQPSPRKTKKRKRDWDGEELPPGKKRPKNERTDSARSPHKDHCEAGAVDAESDAGPVSGAGEELYLPDVRTPDKHRKRHKKKKERVQTNGDVDGSEL